MKSLLLVFGVLLAIPAASAQYRISTSAAAKAKIAIRIMQNAAHSELIDGEFDPFTQGLMDGLQEHLEEDRETGHPGDSRLALMLYNNWLWIVQYRIDHYPEPLRTEIMQWHFDCAHEIDIALRRGVVPKNGGACEFTDGKYKKLHPDSAANNKQLPWGTRRSPRRENFPKLTDPRPKCLSNRSPCAGRGIRRDKVNA